MNIASELPVFTYWEGRMHPFTRTCLDSIHDIFGARHIHLTPKTLSDWIDVNDDFFECKHLIFRSDYIRTMLLLRHGGWWFDSDVLLFSNPDEEVSDGIPMIWNLVYFHEGRWQPLVNCGILFTQPRSTWISAIAEDFLKIEMQNLVMTKENEDIGQQIYERWSYGSEFVRIGHEHAFNSTVNVDANFRPFFDGSIDLESARYGMHIGASLARWAMVNGDQTARSILDARSIDELVCNFPRSVVAQYVRRFASKKCCSEIDI